MSQPINTEKLKRILLVRTDRMGDVVLTTPVFSAIKKKYSFAYLAVLVSKENVDLVRGNPYLDEVIAYDKFGSEKSWWGAYTFIRRLELKRFDAAILFHPRARMYWTTFLARIPIRIGYRAKNFKLLTHILPYNKPEGTRHEAEYNFDLLKMIGVEPPTQLEFYVPLCEGYQKLIDGHLKSLGRYVVFNPSASTPSKIWSAEYFAQVASNLSKKYNVIPVIIGGKEDAPYSDAMKKHMNGIAIDFTGKLGIGALAWLLKKALLFISNDTGPVHVAASLGTPVISIFLRNVPGLGPTRWQPLGAKARYLLEEIVMTPDMANHATIERAQIRTLTPEAIEKIVEEEGWLSRDKVQL